MEHMQSLRSFDEERVSQADSFESISTRPVWAEVDLDAIRHNLNVVREMAGTARLLAVVKANAYGHGAVAIAQAALGAGATRLAVACVDEGEELRQAGIQAPVLILGYTPPEDAARVAALALEPTVSSIEAARAFSRAALSSATRIQIHVEVDSGFNRNGVSLDQVVPLAEHARQLGGIEVRSLFTHFATADEPEHSFASKQFDAFLRVSSQLSWIPERHCAASATIFSRRERVLDTVRVGLAMYGYSALVGAERNANLRPALALRSLVARVWEVPAGSCTGYGRTWQAKERSRLALLACGYADGYRRSLGNRAEVLIRGRRVLVAGRVSMDMCVVDVTQVPEVKPGDVATLLGRDGSQEVDAIELGELAGTISWDILAGITTRVPRLYLTSGKGAALPAKVGRGSHRATVR